MSAADLIAAILDQADPTTRVFGRIGSVAEHAGEMALARSLRKFDYNAEIVAQIDVFDNTICAASRGEAWDIDALIGSLDPTSNFAGEFDAMLASDWIRPLIKTVLGNLVVYTVMSRLNSGVHHNFDEAVMWVTAHPDYVPTECGCEVAARMEKDAPQRGDA